MAKTELGSNAQYTGNGKGLTVIGRHCYAYNFFSIDDTTIDYFDFSTGKRYIVAKLIGGRNMKSAAECTVLITFNGVSIFKTKWDNGTSGTNNNPMSSATPFIIPPLTRVKVTLTTDTQDEISMGITGELFDHKDL